MTEELRMNIAETCGVNSWEQVTALQWQDGTPWALWKFDQDVEYGGERWRCVIVQKVIYDPQDVTAVDYAEDVLAEAWKI